MTLPIEITEMMDYLCPHCGYVVYPYEAKCEICGKLIPWSHIKTSKYLVLREGQKGLIGKTLKIFADPATERKPLHPVVVERVLKQTKKFLVINEGQKVLLKGRNFVRV